MNTAWIIPLLLLIPTLSALAMLLPSAKMDDRRFACSFAVGSGILTFLVSLVAAGFFFTSTGDTMQLVGTVQWVDAFGLSFGYGVDGISMWLVLLTTFMMPLAMLNAFTTEANDGPGSLPVGSAVRTSLRNMVRTADPTGGVVGELAGSKVARVREYFFWMLLLEAILLGVFVTRDIISFYLCYELTLVPLYFLVALFGREDRVKAAKVFFLYAFAGSMLTLASFLYIVWFAHLPGVLTSAGKWTFNIRDLYAAAHQMDMTQQGWVLLGMLIGFAVKTPLFPLHTWMPFVHTETPRNGSVDVAGVLLKIGLYGLIRLAVPMTPKAIVAFAPYIGAFAVISILYCAIISWTQSDYKRLVAYSSVSHMGFCVMGLFALDATGIGPTGSIMHLINQGLATGAMFLCVGMIYERFHTRQMNNLSGLAKVMPIWSFFMMFFVFASIGLPGLNGFVGEFLTMMGTFVSPVTLGIPYAVVAAISMILAAMYLLLMSGKLVFGPVKLPEGHGENEGGAGRLPRDLTRREITLLAPIALVCLWLGLAPFSVLQSLQKPMDQLIHPAQLVAMREQSTNVKTVRLNSTTTLTLATTPSKARAFQAWDPNAPTPTPTPGAPTKWK